MKLVTFYFQLPFGRTLVLCALTKSLGAAREICFVSCLDGERWLHNFLLKRQNAGNWWVPFFHLRRIGVLCIPHKLNWDEMDGPSTRLFRWRRRRRLLLLVLLLCVNENRHHFIMGWAICIKNTKKTKYEFTLYRAHEIYGDSCFGLVERKILVEMWKAMCVHIIQSKLTAKCLYGDFYFFFVVSSACVLRHRAPLSARPLTITGMFVVACVSSHKFGIVSLFPFRLFFDWLYM